jgi:hypothetical protein
MSITTDPNDPRLCHGNDNEPGPQCDVYLVLSEEERAKGFVCPVRTSYVHVGRKDSNRYKGIHRILTEAEQLEYPDKKYVAVMTVLENEDGSFKGGPYVTKEELDAWRYGEYIGGCGTITTMGIALSETYARNPKFYGATYCTGCQKHLPVGEFIWYGTNIKVGD